MPTQKPRGNYPLGRNEHFYLHHAIVVIETVLDEEWPNDFSYKNPNHRKIRQALQIIGQILDGSLEGTPEPFTHDRPDANERE